MNSKDYWAKRSALDMVEYMRTADETALLMRQNAMQAFTAIEEEIKGIFSAFAGFGISEAEAKQIISGDGTVLQRLRRAAEKLTDPQQKQALLSAINSAGAYRYRIQRLEEVGRQITEQCNALYKAQLEATETALASITQEAYYRTIFNIQQQTGLAFSFAQFPKNQVNRILAFNWSGTHFSQRIWRNTEILAQSIKDELLVSLLSGRSEAKTARIIKERFNVNSYCAKRLVRTESSYAANAAVFESYSEAGIDGYRFIATLDFKTSEKCAELDSKVFKTSDKKVGTNAPPMHPFCRSTTIADFSADTLIGLERRVRGKDGKNVVLPADMSYADWRKQFVEEKALDKSAGSGIIKSLDIDDFELMASTHEVDNEVAETITSVVKQYEKSKEININDFYFGSLEAGRHGTPLLQIEPIGNKMIRLNVNTDVFGGRTEAEINNLLAAQNINLANNLREAVIHECGHAKAIKGLTTPQIEALYKEIADAHITGVSDIAYLDGAEALAEIEVLISRGSKVPDEALKFYKKYMQR